MSADKDDRVEIKLYEASRPPTRSCTRSREALVADLVDVQVLERQGGTPGPAKSWVYA